MVRWGSARPPRHPSEPDATYQIGHATPIIFSTQRSVIVSTVCRRPRTHFAWDVATADAFEVRGGVGGTDESSAHPFVVGRHHRKIVRSSRRRWDHQRIVRATILRWISPQKDRSKFAQMSGIPTNHPRRCGSQASSSPMAAHRSNNSWATASPRESVFDPPSNLDQATGTKRSIKSKERSSSQDDQHKHPTAHPSPGATAPTNVQHHGAGAVDFPFKENCADGARACNSSWGCCETAPPTPTSLK